MKKILETLKQKWAEYLLETLVITIGILGAFALNNWNEERKSSNAESQALVELLAEFEKNQKDFLRVYKLKKDAENSLRSYLELINDDSIAPDKKNAPYSKFADNTWNARYSVLNGLITSGAIENIKNDSLKYLLTSWNDFVDNYVEQQEFYHKDIVMNYSNFVMDKIPSHYLSADSTYTLLRVEYFEDTAEIAAHVSKVRGNMAYQNFLKICLNRLYIQMFTMQHLLRNYEKIMVLLDEEIAGKQ